MTDEKYVFRMKLHPDHGMDALPRHPVMRRWWAYMGDIMETHPDNEPIAVPLETVFHMD